MSSPLPLPEPAAMKTPTGRDIPDPFAAKAAQMLAFDKLAKQLDVAERSIVRTVVRKNINRFVGCMTLPLTLGYFFFYSFAARLHEDITQVFFLGV